MASPWWLPASLSGDSQKAASDGGRCFDHRYLAPVGERLPRMRRAWSVCAGFARLRWVGARSTPQFTALERELAPGQAELGLAIDRRHGEGVEPLPASVAVDSRL